MTLNPAANEGVALDSIIILSDKLEIKNGAKQYVDMKAKKRFWEGCGEDDVKCAKIEGRVDPVLKLHRRCRVMLTKNLKVTSGLANGTCAIVEQVVLKHGEVVSFIILDNGTQVPAVLASQVSHLILSHTSDRILPHKFRMEPRKYSIKAKLPKAESLRVNEKDKDVIEMKISQLPVVSNDATTGHKLQGRGVDQLYVHNWSYVTNWPYVMLSRVKTMAGLLCRSKLSTDLRKYAMLATNKTWPGTIYTSWKA